MGDPAARLPREMLVKVVLEASVLLRGAWCPLWAYHPAGLGALALCSKAWWDVVVELAYKVDGIIEGKDLLSTTRYCLKLDLSFLFESFEATAQKELGLLGDVSLLWHVVEICRQDRRAPHSESFRAGLKAVFDAATLAYQRVRISANEPRRVCMLHCGMLHGCAVPRCKDRGDACVQGQPRGGCGPLVPRLDRGERGIYLR